MAKSLAAVVDAMGISAPLYADNLANLQDQMRGIYGQDIYIEADSQDGQLIAIYALAQNDTNDMAIAVYNDFSPASAQGVGLSSVVKTNGIRRHNPTLSTVVLTLGGQNGAIITNGIVSDDLDLGTRWLLPQTVVIPVTGTIDVTATSAVVGAVTAPVGSLTNILTSYPGWQTATNNAIPSPGDPVEMDPQLRRRQAKSTALPASTPRAAIEAAIANVVGVTRVRVAENDTNIVTVDGIPPHNIAAVVEGGSVLDVATVIALKKAPGIPTYGPVTQIVYDSKGVPDTIHYTTLTDVMVSLVVFVTALGQYVSSTGTSAVSALAEYINNLDIQAELDRNTLYGPAMLRGDEATAVTGLPQLTLDTLSKTYKINQIVQNRSDCTILTTVAAGGASLVATNVVDEPFAINDDIYVVLTGPNAGFFPVTVTSVAGTSIGFSPVVPLGNTINAGSLIYTERDLNAKFNEAFVTDAAHIQWLVP